MMTPQMIYFDNAATSYPKPPEVFDSMTRFMKELGGNPGRSGHRLATGAEAMVVETRNALSKFFGLKNPDRCIFTMNCTDALNMAIKGVLKKGDHVVTTALEHNSINRPLQRLADDGFITLTRVQPASQGEWSVDEIINATTSKTRLVALTHCSNVCGVINPIADLGRSLREVSDDCLLLVDAAQSAGVVPIDMEAANVDFLAFPGHKALFAPTGTGALLIGPNVKESDILAWREGGTGGDSTSPHQPPELPHHLEGGTPNTMGISGMLAGVRYITKQGGPAKILEHERAIIGRLIEGLGSDKRFTLYGTKDLKKKAGALSLTIKDRDNAEVASILDQAFSICVRPGLHCSPYTHKHLGTFPTGTIRLSPGHFSTLEEADAVIKALLEIAS
jgi:cysteine desulfurase/selenocysteine lyase